MKLPDLPFLPDPQEYSEPPLWAEPNTYIGLASIALGIWLIIIGNLSTGIIAILAGLTGIFSKSRTKQT